MSEIGHNSAAQMSAAIECIASMGCDAIAAEQALAGLSSLQSRRSELLASFDRSPCGSDPKPLNAALAEGVTNLIAKIGALLNAADNAHALAKEPWLSAGRVVDGVRAKFRIDLEDARDSLNGALNAWQRAETERVNAERAAQAAKFEQIGDPEPQYVPQRQTGRMAKPGTVRTGIGASATLQDQKTVTIEDPKKVPVKYLRRPGVLAAIAKEVRADALRGEKIPGVAVSIDAKTIVRK